MPLPKSKNVGTVMHKLNAEKPGMPQKQKVAIALNVAREAGAPIPYKDKAKQVMKKRSME